MKFLALAALLSAAAVPAFAEGTNETSTSYKQVATETTITSDADIEPAAGPATTSTQTTTTTKSTFSKMDQPKGTSFSSLTRSNESTPEEGF